MANEEQKFREAAYFLGVMKANVNDRNAFIYNFSALITAARSVVQYAFEECRPDPTARAWYDNYISNTDMIRYFRDKRDINIHEEPVLPNAAYHVEATMHLTISGTFSVKVLTRDSDGNLVEQSTAASDAAERAIAAPAPRPTSENKVSVRYFLADRKNDDLIDLAETYMNELIAFLHAARAAGYVPAT
jgi:hypothetical protein